ncbi:glycosyltransferase family 2 protein [Rhodobacteraceae bacterium NNCM2]|nr:glycosyltransferase family 2 protein [Coraliihabitans acroporae]
MKISMVSMIRNENDIIEYFLSRSLYLFDTILIVDMNSTDGTEVILEEYANSFPEIEIYKLPYQARYQSQSLTTLANHAFEEGADWVFPLDCDEFLAIASRDDLEEHLSSVSSPFFHMPWVNLVPTQYGTFNQFDTCQEFRWSGRASTYKKIVISREYARANVDFHLEPGSHNVRPFRLGLPEAEFPGPSLFHIPVRSLDRIRYKAHCAIELRANTHTTRENESTHHSVILNRVSEASVTTNVLDTVAATYGSQEAPASALSEKHDWPVARLPFAKIKLPEAKFERRGETEAHKLTAELAWNKINAPKRSEVVALREDGSIRISPISVRGTGSSGPFRFDRLPSDERGNYDAPALNELIRVFSASTLEPMIEHVSSTIMDLPLYASIVALANPRRYVALGVGNGDAFLSACRVSETLAMKTECIAIDSWSEGPDERSSDDSEFAAFKARLKNSFSDQLYLQGFPLETSALFACGSIDLLQISKLTSAEIDRKDFVVWRSKMSERGVIVFNDIMPHDIDKCASSLWEDVKNDFPSIELPHGQGTGILYLGNDEGILAELMSSLQGSPDCKHAVLQYFKTMGERLHASKVRDFREREERGVLVERVAALEGELIAKKRAHQDYLQEIFKEQASRRELMIHRHKSQIEALRTGYDQRIDRTGSRHAHEIAALRNALNLAQDRLEQERQLNGRFSAATRGKITKPFRKLTRSLRKRFSL